MLYIRGCEIKQVDIADDFYEAYIRCFQKENDGKIVAVPAFVNGLFACELYFKCLIEKKIIGHNLKDLFNALDEEKKKKLLMIKCDERYTLEGLLKSIGNGFEVWRYCFETQEENQFEKRRPFEYSEAFLQTYLPVLKEMAHQYCSINSKNK